MNDHTRFFAKLEELSPEHVDISNWLLLQNAQKALRRFTGEAKRSQVQAAGFAIAIGVTGKKIVSLADKTKQFEDLKQTLLPDFDDNDDPDDPNDKVALWWTLEKVWFDHASKTKFLSRKDFEPALLYRLLVVFFRNLQQCPFRDEDDWGEDDSEFKSEQQKLFRSFCSKSIDFLRSQEAGPPFDKLPAILTKFKGIDLASEYESTRDELLDKDWDILKGILLGGAVGMAASLFLGPIIGGWIGNAVGLSGAAATSYGLALLGGGSLASGGFGMVGGKILLGLGFGLAGGIKGGIKGASVDELNLTQAEINLPSMISVAAILHRHCGDNLISDRIGQMIEAKHRQFAKMRPGKPSKYTKKLVGLYKKASEMCNDYDSWYWT